MARDTIGVIGGTGLRGGIVVKALLEKENMYKEKKEECACESDSLALGT